MDGTVRSVVERLTDHLAPGRGLIAPLDLHQRFDSRLVDEEVERPVVVAGFPGQDAGLPPHYGGSSCTRRSLRRSEWLGISVSCVPEVVRGSPPGSAAYDLTVVVSDASDLYGVAFERFVAERAALAKVLRGEGRRAEAERVAGLPKPSIAAWAVNQLARTQRAALAALFAAGDELLRVHAELLDGRGDPGALRAATVRERDAVNQLTEAAHGLLSEEGHELSAATLARVSETLHAAARERQARDLVRVGRLERELRHVGLGSDAAVTGPVAREPRAAGAGPLRTRDTASTERARPPQRQAGAEQADSERDERQRPEREQVEQRRAERERAARLTAARRAESNARRHAGQAARELDAAQERRDRAAQALHDAEVALADAQAQAEAAARDQRSAQQALQNAERPASPS